jgi:hypothetical protein
MFFGNTREEVTYLKINLPKSEVKKMITIAKRVHKQEKNPYVHFYIRDSELCVYNKNSHIVYSSFLKLDNPIDNIAFKVCPKEMDNLLKGKHKTTDWEIIGSFLLDHTHEKKIRIFLIVNNPPVQKSQFDSLSFKEISPSFLLNLKHCIAPLIPTHHVFTDYIKISSKHMITMRPEFILCMLHGEEFPFIEFLLYKTTAQFISTTFDKFEFFYQDELLILNEKNHFFVIKNENIHFPNVKDFNIKTELKATFSYGNSMDKELLFDDDFVRFPGRAVFNKKLFHSFIHDISDDVSIEEYQMIDSKNDIGYLWKINCDKKYALLAGITEPKNVVIS